MSLSKALSKSLCKRVPDQLLATDQDGRRNESPFCPARAVELIAPIWTKSSSARALLPRESQAEAGQRALHKGHAEGAEESGATRTCVLAALRRIFGDGSPL